MEETDKRYVQLIKDTNRFLLGDASLVLCGKAVTYDNKEDKVLAQIKLQSIAEKSSVAIKIVLKGFDN